MELFHDWYNVPSCPAVRLALVDFPCHRVQIHRVRSICRIYERITALSPSEPVEIVRRQLLYSAYVKSLSGCLLFGRPRQIRTRQVDCEWPVCLSGVLLYVWDGGIWTMKSP